MAHGALALAGLIALSAAWPLRSEAYVSSAKEAFDCRQTSPASADRPIYLVLFDAVRPSQSAVIGESGTNKFFKSGPIGMSAGKLVFFSRGRETGGYPLKTERESDFSISISQKPNDAGEYSAVLREGRVSAALSCKPKFDCSSKAPPRTLCAFAAR